METKKILTQEEKILTQEEKKLTEEEKVFLKIIQELFLNRGLRKEGEIILAKEGLLVKYPSYFSFSNQETGRIITDKLLKEEKKTKEEKKEERLWNYKH